MKGNRFHINQYLWHAVGLIFILEVGSLLCWENPLFWRQNIGNDPGFLNAQIFMFVIAASYVSSILCAKRIASTPRCGRMVSAISGVSCCFAVSMLCLFLARLYYSRSFLLYAFTISFLWIYMGLRVFFSSDMVRYGFLPGTVISELRDVWRNNFIELSLRDTQDAFDVLVVTPYQGKTLTSEWARYVTNMMIQGVPVVHPGTVYEFFTGRLPIEYMAEELGVIFRPPLVYPYVKRFIDLIMIALCLFPAILCTLVIALAALCSSGRPIFFVQKRIGKNGVPFLMYKFRSMTASGEVTSVGRYLRKCHMDELPQILNVLRGEMSFIGPRPETPDLAARYARDIPFYPYRYSMRPGITGWAQVNYGYASVTSENKIKLGYDLYYIKHASFVLEISIILKTVKIVLFGFK